MANGTGNKEYRSDVFSMLLQDKKRALEIYNAINETAYDDPELVEIPAPQFVVFYNRKESAPEHYELRLPDAFEKKTDPPQLELVCKVYNINKGSNEEFLAKCPTLRDYMYFIDAVREYHIKNNFTDLGSAIEQAINQCIRENVLREFLIEHRTEVTRMMTMDYTFERRLEFQCEEAMEKGVQQGRAEERN